MRPIRWIVAVVAVAPLLSNPAAAWEAKLGKTRSDAGIAIVADPSGDVFTGGALYGGTTDQDFAVVALDATTGAEIWRYVVDGGVGGADFVTHLALDAAGDVLALGVLRTALGSAGIVKLDGATGAEIWRRDLPAPLDDGDLAVDASGDVLVAAGNLGGGGALLKLDGTSGADVWQATACAFGPLAVDGSGDVLGSPGFPPGVCKTDGLTGAPLWTQATPQQPTDVAVDASGDVAMSGDGFLVVKLSGATGTVAWQQSLGIAIFGDRANALAFDGSGNVIAGGLIDAVPYDYNLVELDGASGAEVWRGRGAGEVLDLGLTPGGDVMAAADKSVTFFRASDGQALWLSDGGAPLAVDSSGQTASIPGDRRGWRVVETGGPLAGRALTVVDTPAGTKVVLKVKDRAILMPQVVTTSGDPLNPIQVGAVLELRNPGTGESDTIALPATNWSASGNFGLLKYADRDGSEGPCRSVKVTRKLLKVSCKGSAFTLDEAAQGSLRATLLFGGDPLARQCAEFGGNVRIDVPGAFKATTAPPPPICP